MFYDKVTRILHWSFALLIPLQLLSESLMQRPKPERIRDDMQILFFEMHEWVGMLALMFVLIHLIWNLINPESSWGRLYPYFSTESRSLLTDELKNKAPSWFKGQLATPNNKQYIAGAVHGLGLLLVLIMGVTGATMLYGMQDSGLMLGLTHDAKEVHEVLGGLVWLYIIGHVGMTILHMLSGHSMLKRMFSLRTKQ